MGRRTKGVIRDRTDYTRLLLELQGRDTPVKQVSPIASAPKPALSPFRQRIMSSEAVRFLYSPQGGYLHDKSCSKAKDIPDEELLYTEEYLPDGTRIFTPRYHVQAEWATTRYALTVIAEYTYEGQKVRMAQKAQEAQEQQSKELSKDQGVPPKPRSFIRWLWRVVEGYLAKLFSASKY